MRRTGDDSGAARSAIAMGGCGIVLVVALAMGAGACMLYKHRTGAGARAASEAKPTSEIDAIRSDLLVLSGEISRDDASGAQLTRVENRLEAIALRLDDQREDPDYLKVKALHRSVQLQLEFVSGGEEPEIPRLPPSSFAPTPDERLVGKTLKKSSLIRSKIFTPSAGMNVKYGTGRFSVEHGAKKSGSIGGLIASEGWEFFIVEVGVRGKVDLVEYKTVLLDDYRRGFPPHLEGEKELAKITTKSAKLKTWRATYVTTNTKKPTWLTRIFILPSESTSTPILEIHRQGASKRLWIQL